jgi:glyoxylase-like metal-dependent hydrolase (beta-lactamase superfamily II)
MKIKILSLGQLKTNCYILYNDKNCIVVDPADDTNCITEVIEGLRVKPTAIIATHGHFDHNLASGELQLIYKIPFYIHKNDLFLLKSINSSAKHWLKIEADVIVPYEISFIDEDMKLKLGNEIITIYQTPGHTPGSICLKTDIEIFTGDTLFKNDVGRYDFSYSSKEQMELSLQKLMKLPTDLIVYPGHGELTTIGDEKKN